MRRAELKLLKSQPPEITKDVVFNRYMQGETPSVLAKEYNISLMQIKLWVKEEAWDLQKSDKAIADFQQVLNRLGLKGKNDIAFDIHLDLQFVRGFLSKELKAKAKAGNLSTIKDILEILKRINDLDKDIQVRLGLK